ncbi:hypothetical protein ABZ383_10515 [Streptomyces sp. NPDC005900]|uniref:hypothetical protein n=1 Tax=Streptomyces sp. NPDC005900 TaxID=3154569 RepID=UPI0033E72738
MTGTGTHAGSFGGTGTAPAASTGTAPAAAGAVEERLGDPFDDANPYGFRAVLAADEAGRTPPGGDILTSLGLAGEPPASEALWHVLRALHRRSPRAAAGHPPTGAAADVVRLGATAGALDSALRITLRHLRARRLYGAAAIDIPYLRALLAGAYADLLLSEALTVLAVRGGDPRPALFLGPRVMQGALDRLSVVMGSRFYLREGEHAVFQALLGQAQRVLFAPGGPARPAAPVTPDALLATPEAAELCDPRLLAAAPGRRLLTSASRRVPQPAGPAAEGLHAQLGDRYDAGLSFGLTGHPVPDRP